MTGFTLELCLVSYCLLLYVSLTFFPSSVFLLALFLPTWYHLLQPSTSPPLINEREFETKGKKRKEEKFYNTKFKAKRLTLCLCMLPHLFKFLEDINIVLYFVSYLYSV